jgi:hypothetical protein
MLSVAQPQTVTNNQQFINQNFQVEPPITSMFLTRQFQSSIFGSRKASVINVPKQKSLIHQCSQVEKPYPSMFPRRKAHPSMFPSRKASVINVPN